MELWIRSQDKLKLAKVNQLEYDYTEIKGEERHKIVTVLNNDCFVLGIYKTKERALKVLDLTQNTLANCIKSNFNEKLEGTSCYVYQMPQE